ncbi:hypothetical protein KY285_006427 [Solanum tuberosum]|nr:hypothetical protein KY285_006427 [Solanum tuberosum]
MASQGPYTSAPYFTPEQYHQLLHLLDHGNESNGTALSASGMSNYNTSPTGGFNWIVDTGATHHMDLYSRQVRGIGQHNQVRKQKNSIGLSLWHKRLGHVPIHTLKKLKYFDNIHVSSTLVHAPSTACVESLMPSDSVPSKPPTLPLDVAPRKSHRTTKPPIWMQDYRDIYKKK